MHKGLWLILQALHSGLFLVSTKFTETQIKVCLSCAFKVFLLCSVTVGADQLKSIRLLYSKIKAQYLMQAMQPHCSVRNLQATAHPWMSLQAAFLQVRFCNNFSQTWLMVFHNECLLREPRYITYLKIKLKLLLMKKCYFVFLLTP